MAFIRQYMGAGDPSFAKTALARFAAMPHVAAIRAQRKARGGFFGKVKRAAGRLAPLAASFVPAGSLLARGIAAHGKIKAARRRYFPAPEELEPPPGVIEAPEEFIAEPEEESDVYDPNLDQAIAYVRSYGYEVGDPGPTTKRKGAAAGPRAKASKKRESRATARTGAPKKTGPQKRRPAGGSLGSKIKRGIGSIDPSVLGDLSKIAAKTGLLGKQARNVSFGIVRGTGGGSRRRINPSNMKALKRAARRFEGFEKMVKTARKAVGGLRGVLAPARPQSRSSGHRAGCRCVVCKRAA